jgi:quercetin dioxygenase-like cupin family protein
MAFKVRRVVAGNNDAGAAVVISDENIAAVSRGIGRNITGSEMWSTDAMPVDNSAVAEIKQRKGYIKVYNDYNYVGSGQGTTFRITRWEPGHALFEHRTQTTDYDIVLSGKIDLELEEGQVVHLKAGDVVVLRGCTHSWVNRSDKPAVTAFVLIDAALVEVAGGVLKPIFPVPTDS